MTKRRIRVQKAVKSRSRESIPRGLDARDPEIVQAKQHLYAAGRARRTA